ncbi:unnamed protein product [Leptidea sinapis]|uniref:Polyprenyldihydroxybenzoate methyltransferase n=1 Tax=Leptidea sinapis TaxID=189913 RepID=A0A5E4QX58_9NEOP|nr:unnamed protein product [Leptidea sinapis]
MNIHCAVKRCVTFGHYRLIVSDACKINYSTSNKRATVDDGEIERLSSLVWWGPQSPCYPLRSFNTIRVPFIMDGLGGNSSDKKTINPFANKKLLEVGSGGGILAEALAAKGADIIGLEPGQELVDVAQNHCDTNPDIADNKPKYVCTTIEEHSEQYPGYYDAVVASEVIEHVLNQELFVECCIRALKPGGRIFFTTQSKTFLAWFHHIFVFESVIKLVPKGTHEYDKFITPKTLTGILERHNCRVELVRGMMYYPWSDKWKWIRYSHAYYALQAIKLNN